MARVIIIMCIGFFAIGHPSNAQNKKLPSFLDFRNSADSPAITAVAQSDTLDPKKAKWLENQAKKAERKMARKKEKRIEDIHKEMDPEKVTVAHGNKKLALALFENQAYGAAIEAFNRLSQEDKSSQDVMAKLASSYRLNAQPEAAEYWYGRLVQSTNNPQYQFEYSQILQMNNKCEDALYWYEKYADNTSTETISSGDYLANCRKNHEVYVHDNISLENATSINTEYLDFAPIPTGQGVVFNNSRKSDRFNVNKDCWTQENYTDLFQADGQACDFENIKPLEGGVNGRFHDGAASFAAGGSQMFFTRNNYKGKSKDGLVDLKIWQSVQRDGVWSKAEELTINSDDFTSCHPALSPDGRRLYFASNRPGGFGGLDIYVSHLVDGQWQLPVNLGAHVNSTGNDIFPYVNDQEQLFYSSNGFPGQGGLDIYKVEKTRMTDESSWQNRTNLGQPFNSNKDDFGFYIYPDQSRGFVTSNRDGGLGGDDIYCWQGELFNSPLKAEAVNICFSDQQNGAFIDQAEVIVSQNAHATNGERVGESGDFLLTLKPAGDGQYVLGVNKDQGAGPAAVNKTFFSKGKLGIGMDVYENESYHLTVNKNGYEPLTLNLTGKELLDKGGECIVMNKVSCFMVKGKVDIKENGIKPDQARIVLFDRTENRNSEILVDDDGAFETCVPCGHDFRINGRLDGFDSDYKNFNTRAADCGAGSMTLNTIALNKRKIVVTENVIANTSATTSSAVHGTSNCGHPCGYFVACHSCSHGCADCSGRAEKVSSRVKKVKREKAVKAKPFSEKNLKKGAVIALESIFYDYDKFNIRSDATASLDKLLEIMNQYSDMEIEMRAHTDARGKANYNNWLSRKRAEAARRYLISRGIDCDRISAKGHGERQLLNDCDDDEDCDEQLHQVNRRTEFKILRFN